MLCGHVPIQRPDFEWCQDATRAMCYFNIPLPLRSLDGTENHLTQWTTNPAMSGARRPSRRLDALVMDLMNLMDLMARVFITRNSIPPNLPPKKINESRVCDSMRVLFVSADISMRNMGQAGRVFPKVGYQQKCHDALRSVKNHAGIEGWSWTWTVLWLQQKFMEHPPET